MRNLTIRNRDSRRLISLNFLLRVKELVDSDCRFGFYMKNCTYSQLEISRIPNFSPKIRNSQTLGLKSAISYHTVSGRKSEKIMIYNDFACIYTRSRTIKDFTFCMNTLRRLPAGTLHQLEKFSTYLASGELMQTCAHSAWSNKMN